MHDTFYLVTRWEALFGLALLAALLTAATLVILKRHRPSWSGGLLYVAAAAPAPVLIFIAAAAMITALIGDAKDGWADLARAALFTGALQIAAVAFLVGLAAAWLFDRIRSRR